MPTGTKGVVATRAFQLFDVAAEFLLQEVKTVANVLLKFICKGTELLTRFFGYEQLIDHHGQCSEGCRCVK